MAQEAEGSGSDDGLVPLKKRQVGLSAIAARDSERLRLLRDLSDPQTETNADTSQSSRGVRISLTDSNERASVTRASVDQGAAAPALTSADKL